MPGRSPRIVVRRVGVLLAATLITACSYDWDGPLRDLGDANGIRDVDERDASDADLDSPVSSPPDAPPDTCSSMSGGTTCCSSTPGSCQDTGVPEDASPDPCAQLKDGLYCGFNLKGEAQQDWQNLYQCKDQQASLVQPCKECNSGGIGGMDSCASPMVMDSGADAQQDATAGPCAGLKAGTYCGQELMLDPKTLYKCGGGQPSIVQVCQAGCMAGMGGTDSCAPQMSD